MLAERQYETGDTWEEPTTGRRGTIARINEQGGVRDYQVAADCACGAQDDYFWWSEEAMAEKTRKVQPVKSALTLTLTLADDKGLRWAQQQVALAHYLHAPVDVRCSPLAYLLHLGECRVGCLIFGRPEATRVSGWFGSVEDVASGWCRLTRWEVLNLARVWLDPSIQYDHSLNQPGPLYIPNAATWAIAQALRRVPYDYLAAHPPVFPEQPWMLSEVLSYCDTRKHKGTLYRAANFCLIRTNEDGLQTYAIPLRRLSRLEQQYILKLCEQSPRGKRYRSLRAVEAIVPCSLWENIS